MTAGRWRLDELALLTDEDPLSAIPPGALTFGIVTRDNEALSIPGDSGLAGRRMLACYMMMGGRTLAGARKELTDFFFEHRAQLLP